MRVISTKDGLPQSFVSGLVQDDSSFIWIGTRNGLARFDGTRYQLFQHIPGDTTSLATNIIIWLEKDKKNQLWVEHESGEIDVLDPVTEHIRHFLKGNLPDSSGVRFVRRGWLVDTDGLFWGIVRAAGVNCYDSRTKKLETFTRLHSGIPSDTIRGLAETMDHRLWMVSQKAISLFDKKTRQFSHWTIPYEQDYGVFTGSDAIAISLHERKNGELMWGDRHNLYFFNPVHHSFRSIALPTLSYLGIRWIRSGYDGSDYFENYGQMYRYSDSLGLMSIAKIITGNFGDIKSFLVDRSGLLWIGTNAGGIKQVDLGTPFFQSSVYKDNFGSDVMKQLLGIDMQRFFDWRPEDYQHITPSYQIRSALDSNRRLFLALKATVCYYDNTQHRFIRLPTLPGTPMIAGITILPDGSPAVITTTGTILSYNSGSRTWAPFLDPPTLRSKFGPGLLPQDIFCDGKSFWVTTIADGLLNIDMRSKESRQFFKSNKPDASPVIQLLGLRADPKHSDLLWIGSYEGLIRLEKTNGKAQLLSIKDGLPDNVVYSILSDTLGHLWFSTNKGLCQLDPASKHIRVFHTQHGLPGDEFNRFHHFELMDGRLVFGGPDGWTLFDPRLMKNDNFDPVVAFTDLRINNKEVQWTKSSGALQDKKGILPLPLNAVSQLRLPYDQNSVTVGFAGLEFNQPHELHYRYQLEGYDDDWVPANASHQAAYTKLPPGSYTLRVNASNTSGKWSPHIKTIGIHIAPPWWSTWLAYLVYLAILVALIWLFIRIRVSRMVMRKEIDMKSRFFSSITHEFRTPLTLIIGPAEQLRSLHSNQPQESKLAGTILSNARQLLSLVNRLLDLSRLEAHAFPLTEQRGDPGTVVAAVVQSFEVEARAREVDLSFQAGAGGDHTGQLGTSGQLGASGQSDGWFYPEALERIVYNLVSNALKFTPAGGTIDVSLSAAAGTLRLEVCDTGLGIAPDKLPHIFDRYYQVGQKTTQTGQSENQARQSAGAEPVQKGSGIGLSVVRELVDQVQGTIAVESRTERTPGARFTLIIPFREEQSPAAPAVREEDALRVLVVEDNKELADFVMGILSPHFEVEYAHNGAAGLDLALESMPDLIISDVMMPVMDGYEFCRRVKADIRTSHIPVILLTAKTTQENRIEGLTLGANDYISKPFHPAELLLRIRNLLTVQQQLRDRVRRELSSPDKPAATTQGDVPSPLTPTDGVAPRVTTDRPATQAPPVIEDIFLTRLYQQLDEHLDDAYFGVDQLVSIMNISRSSLHRKLKSITGLTTTEVVRNYRLKLAANFLRQGYSSQEAAYKTGFGSPAYFSKCFREVYGLTPSDFIRDSRIQVQ